MVGGLVPSLLIRAETLPKGVDAHVGTVDLDLGMQLAILDEERYRTLPEQLQRAGFSPDQNQQGNPTHQRWKIEVEQKITVDFLMPPNASESRGGRLLHLERTLAAVIAPGLQLAFRDRIQVTLSGVTIRQERATRSIWVCGPGAYVVLKALAFRNRGEGKDAYDLCFVVRNFGSGVPDVVRHFQPLLDEPDAQRALEVLREDFLDLGGLGPRRIAEFLVGAPDGTIQGDVVALVDLFLRLLQTVTM